MGDESGLFIRRRYVIHAVFLFFLYGFQCDSYLKDLPIWNRGGGGCSVDYIHYSFGEILVAHGDDDMEVR